MALQTSHGTTVTLATSSFDSGATRLLSVEWSGWSRQAIDVTDMATTTGRAFIASSLYDAGTVTLSMHYDPALDYTMVAEEAVTIAFGGQSTLKDVVCNGFITDVSRSSGDPDSGYPTIDVTFKMTGSLTDSA